jgi:hypothetical protein
MVRSAGMALCITGRGTRWTRTSRRCTIRCGHPPVCHFLFCDRHVAGLMREEIVRSLFYVNTPPESSAGR